MGIVETLTLAAGGTIADTGENVAEHVHAEHALGGDDLQLLGDLEH